MVHFTVARQLAKLHRHHHHHLHWAQFDSMTRPKTEETTFENVSISFYDE